MADPEILLFGGAFNPVTIGHIQTANNAMFWCQSARSSMSGNYAIINARDFLFSAVWFLPCYRSRWGKPLVDGKHRVEMIRMSIEESACSFNFMDVSDFEIVNELEGGSYDIVRKIQDRYPNCRFSFLIGADHADRMPAWVEGKKFIEEFRFVVAGRAGVKPRTDWYFRSPHIYVPFINTGKIISSTIARAQISQEGESDLVYPSVMNYIKENGLYHE